MKLRDGRDTAQWYSVPTMRLEAWCDFHRTCFDWNEI